MYEIVNKAFLNGDMLLLGLHLRPLRFTCSACVHFTWHSERTKKNQRNRWFNLNFDVGGGSVKAISLLDKNLY